jgi:hypothetical protein
MVYEIPNSDAELFAAVDDIMNSAAAVENQAQAQATELRREQVEREQPIFEAFAASHPVFAKYLDSWIDEEELYTAEEIEGSARFVYQTSEDINDRTEAYVLMVVCQLVAKISQGLELVDEEIDVKRDLQASVLADQHLIEDVQNAALKVIDTLVPGEGIDMSDPDDYVAAIQEAREADAAQAHRMQLARNMGRLVGNQKAFLEKHTIHPEDPQWQALRMFTAEYMVELTKIDAKRRSILRAAQVAAVGTYLRELWVSTDDYLGLLDTLEDQV